MIQVQIETIAVCNAACVFCPYPTMKRPRGRMSEDLFVKIITEAAGIPAISEISFQGLGEPLLDSAIVPRIAFAKRSRPGWRTTMYTNGNKLTEAVVDSLEAAGLDVLYVSLNAIDARMRKDIMKLDDYERVSAVLRRSIRDRRMKIIPKAVVGMDLFAGEDTDVFKQQWPDAYMHLEGNWAGGTWNARVVSEKACGRALSQIMVLWDGRVALCCFDGEGEVIFGDLRNEALRDIYSKDEYVRYRQAHAEGRRKELRLCDNCTAI
jgi:radical SAM protein with 4Fe4S-binding SPASM domain